MQENFYFPAQQNGQNFNSFANNFPTQGSFNQGTQNDFNGMQQSMMLPQINQPNTSMQTFQSDLLTILIKSMYQLQSTQPGGNNFLSQSQPNPLNGVSENEKKQQLMKDDYKSYLRQVQQSTAELKPRHLRQRNPGNEQITPGIGKTLQPQRDNAFIFDNQSVYDPPQETRAKQRYENSFHAYSRGSSRQGLLNQNNNQNMQQQLQRTLQQSQSMPDLGGNSFNNNRGSLPAIPEENGEQSIPMNNESDVNYNHYINNQNQNVNTMTINRNDQNYQNRPTTSMARPITSNYQNYNWNQGAAQTLQMRQNGMMPPTTSGQLWNPGNIIQKQLKQRVKLYFSNQN